MYAGLYSSCFCAESRPTLGGFQNMLGKDAGLMVLPPCLWTGDRDRQRLAAGGGAPLLQEQRAGGQQQQEDAPKTGQSQGGAGLRPVKPRRGHRGGTVSRKWTLICRFNEQPAVPEQQNSYCVLPMLLKWAENFTSLWSRFISFQSDQIRGHNLPVFPWCSSD